MEHLTLLRDFPALILAVGYSRNIYSPSRFALSSSSCTHTQALVLYRIIHVIKSLKSIPLGNFYWVVYIH